MASLYADCHHLGPNSGGLYKEWTTPRYPDPGAQLSKEGEAIMPDCDFCDIVSGTTPAEIVYATETTLAFFPLEPATRGHTMVITKEHVDNFLEVPDQLIPPLWQAVTDVGRALHAVLDPEGMNVISSAGEAASQSIYHVHVHLVPRWKGDAVGEIWPPKEPTSETLLEDVADAIRQYLRTESLEHRNNEENDSYRSDHDVERPPRS